MVDLTDRSDEQELMDDLDCQGEVVDQTLRELDVINTLLGGNQISISAFKKIALSQKTPVKLVDVGCGGGDILKVLAKWCRSKKIEASFVGIDANPNIIAYAEKNCEEFPEISFQSLNVLDKRFEALDFNILHACLFTHHFTSAQLVHLFRVFRKTGQASVIINDLHRHSLAYYSILLLTKLFSKSPMVQYDAALSVARGFKKNELTSILQKAGIEQFKIGWKWAFRWKLTF